MILIQSPRTPEHKNKGTGVGVQDRLKMRKISVFLKDEVDLDSALVHPVAAFLPFVLCTLL